MKHSTMLTISSLLSILFLTIHLTSDFLHNAGELSLRGVLISSVVLALLLYGTLMLAGRKSGYVILLIVGLFAVGMPVLHLRSPRGVAHALERPDAFFFVWILLALGVIGAFSFILSVRGLWKREWAQSR